MGKVPHDTSRVIVQVQGPGSLLQKAIGGDLKGNLSPWVPLVAGLLYTSVAIIWLVPDRRIERVLRDA